MSPAPGSRRLRLDPVACDGRGLCAELLHELIQLDEWGFPIISADPVPVELELMAQRAVSACPVLALSLVNVPVVPPAAPVRVDGGARGGARDQPLRRRAAQLPR